LEPGYVRVLIAPQPGDLKWAQGRVPTPRGVVECYWKKAERGRFEIDLTLPPKTPARIELPVRGKVTVRNGKARKVAGPRGMMVLEIGGPSVRIEVRKE
ncbi:MAG: alpha-L-rhamnosidase C-terminal domain-containing protein, partial [Tepidisphaeraceae bacterium]